MKDYIPGNSRVMIKSAGYKNPRDYINEIKDPKTRGMFLKNLNAQKVNRSKVKELVKLIQDNKLQLLVFSASWCKDCQKVVPALCRIHEIAGNIPMVILGNIKVNLNKFPQWHSPPSPPEVNYLRIKKVPAILILNQDLIEITRIYEQPPSKKSLEQHLIDLISSTLEK
ncbi:MAG: TlpA family protein disulfide reductase [Promethearchaeota archaeon]